MNLALSTFVQLLVQWNIAANNRITRKHYANAMPLRSRWSHVYGDGMARWVHERTHRFLKAVSLPTATSGVHQPISVDDIATLPLGGARDDAPDAAFDARWDMEKVGRKSNTYYVCLQVTTRIIRC